MLVFTWFNPKVCIKTNHLVLSGVFALQKNLQSLFYQAEMQDVCPVSDLLFSLLFWNSTIIFLSLPQCLASLWCWRSSLCHFVSDWTRCLCPLRGWPALSRHGHSNPRWWLPQPSRARSSEEEEARGKREKKLSLSTLWEGLQQRWEVEGALLLPYRREAVPLHTHRLHQGLCLKVQTATVGPTRIHRLVLTNKYLKTYY